MLKGKLLFGRVACDISWMVFWKNKIKILFKKNVWKDSGRGGS